MNTVAITVNAQRKYAGPSNSAFSLVELLAVMAVVVMMTALLLPSLSGWGSTIGRRGAVTSVMNTLEHARVAALESGQLVYFAVANENHPNPDNQFASFMVFREATEEEVQASGGTRKYVILKNWTPLPKNVAFKSQFPTLGASFVQTDTDLAGLNQELPTSGQLTTERLPVLRFNSTGSVEGSAAPLFIYEGYFANGQDNFTRDAGRQNSSAGLFEKITISRFTGRVQLDVSGI